jgi:hypothetical protein
MRLILVSLFISSLALPAFADNPNGAALVKACSSKPGTPDSDECMSYFNGFVAGLTAAKQQGNSICLPSAIDTQRIREAVIGFLYAHQQTWKADGNAATAVALEMLYPCKKSN